MAAKVIRIFSRRSAPHGVADPGSGGAGRGWTSVRQGIPDGPGVPARRVRFLRQLLGLTAPGAGAFPGREPKSSRFFIFRILLLGAAAYAIIKLLGLNVAVALTGLLVSAAAVILELIYELIYART